MTPLFRGKRKDKPQEWVEGYLYQDPTGTYIKRGNMSTRFGCGVDVIPETVGMASPFTDKTGRKIFSGDLTEIYDVKYSVKYGGFVLDGIEVFGWYLENAAGTTSLDYGFAKEMEITSSIHD